MGAKILIVDDDAVTAEATADALKDVGYEVHRANNGPDRLKLADGLGPDLIILDVMMPDMDGYEVCRRLRQNPNTARLPIIMLTAQTSLEDKIKGLEVGTDDAADSSGFGNGVAQPGGTAVEIST